MAFKGSLEKKKTKELTLKFRKIGIKIFNTFEKTQVFDHEQPCDHQFKASDFPKNESPKYVKLTVAKPMPKLVSYDPLDENKVESKEGLKWYTFDEQ